MAGKFTVTNASAQIIAADQWRSELTIQNYKASAVAFNLGIDQAAVADEGIRLEPGEACTIIGDKARRAIYGITASGSADGGHE